MNLRNRCESFPPSRAKHSPVSPWICLVVFIGCMCFFSASPFSLWISKRPTIHSQGHRHRAERSPMQSTMMTPSVPCTSHLARADRCATIDAIRAVSVEAELQEALTNKSVLMIGDSRSNQLLRYIMGLLNPKHRTDKIFHRCDKFMVVSDASRNITITFVFNPFPNDEMLETIHKWLVVREAKLDYIFLETGAWTIYTYGWSAARSFKYNLTHVVTHLKKWSGSTAPVWIKTLPLHSEYTDLPFGWPNSKYNHTEKMGDFHASIVEQIVKVYQIPLWTTAHTIAKLHPEMYHDRVHPGKGLLRAFACQLASILSQRTCH